MGLFFPSLMVKTLSPAEPTILLSAKKSSSESACKSRALSPKPKRKLKHKSSSGIFAKISRTRSHEAKIECNEIDLIRARVYEFFDDYWTKYPLSAVEAAAGQHHHNQTS